MKAPDAYSQVTRQMVERVQDDIKDIKEGMDNLNSKVTELFNHQSSRLPFSATLIITILSSLVTGLGVYILTRGA